MNTMPSNNMRPVGIAHLIASRAFSAWPGAPATFKIVTRGGLALIVVVLALMVVVLPAIVRILVLIVVVLPAFVRVLEIVVVLPATVLTEVLMVVVLTTRGGIFVTTGSATLTMLVAVILGVTKDTTG